MIKVLTISILSILVSLSLAEAVLRAATAFDENYIENSSLVRDIIYRAYSAEELDGRRSLYLAKQGGECILYSPAESFSYHPYFGFNLARIDRKCVRDLFSSTPLSVVFLGGSVMQNTFAPNHLTTIDSSVNNVVSDMVSINVAESGSRSTNEMIRLLLELVELNPAAVIFLDGFNEFNSIRHGGDPEDDFYWTAGVKHRVHNPFFFLLDKLTAHSALLQLTLLRTRLMSSPRGAQHKPSEADIVEAAQLYIRNVDKIDRLCAIYQIRCFFFLQPTLFTQPSLSAVEKRILQDALAFYPGVNEVIRHGYSEIKKALGIRSNFYDLSDLLDYKNDTVFIDMVHINKLGNAAIGRKMGEVLLTALK